MTLLKHEREEPTWYLDDTYPLGHNKSDSPPLLKWDIDGDPWHIKQCYTQDPARQVMCGLCHGNNFEVSQDSYFTGIRCSKCKIEFCIHEG